MTCSLKFKNNYWDRSNCQFILCDTCLEMSISYWTKTTTFHTVWYYGFERYKMVT